MVVMTMVMMTTMAEDRHEWDTLRFGSMRDAVGGHHFRVRASSSSGIPRSNVCLGQKMELSDGHEEQWEKRQIETDLVGKRVPPGFKALGFFSGGVSETPWLGE